MRFKIGDKVVLSDAPTYMRELCRGATSGKVIKQCNIVGHCSIVRLTNGQEKHLYHHWLSPAPIKNQQLLFNFMYES